MVFFKLFKNNIIAKLTDNLLIGIEHTTSISDNAIIKICYNTKNNINTENDIYDEISNDIKTEIVLKDPKFGMMSLFKYQFNNKNTIDAIINDNIFSITHIFSIYLGLPIMIYICQWLIFISLLYNITNHEPLCPNNSDISKKILMIGISILYFTKSFAIWDSITNKLKLYKTYPCIDICCIIDTFQEFFFMVSIFILNLWIIFRENDLQNMIFNSIAMDFIMELDNDFQRLYFMLLPNSICDIYDRLFISYDKSIELHNKKIDESFIFKLAVNTFYIPFKIVLFIVITLPIITFIFIFISTYCK